MRERKVGDRHPTPVQRPKAYPEILGDVVICPEFAQKFSKRYNNTPEQEIVVYLIHGILHLLGYADTKTEADTLMHKEQARLLKQIIKP